MKKISFEAKTALPTKWGLFSIHAVKSEFPEFPHMALVAEGTRLSDETDPVNVRIHSECMTGDLFGSTRCDCGEQLDFSMEYLALHGGVLLYLRQEGRGIGIVNKLKAYNLQDQGMDTFQANRELGFHDDERDFSVAVKILDTLNIHFINLITNNPNKLSIFEDSGIQVVDRIAVEISPNQINLNYLRAKKKFHGHFLSKI